MRGQTDRGQQWGKVKTPFFKVLGLHSSMSWVLSCRHGHVRTHTHTHTLSCPRLIPLKFKIKACLCFDNSYIISLPLTHSLNPSFLHSENIYSWGPVLQKAPTYEDNQTWWVVRGFYVWCFRLNLMKLPILGNFWPTQWPFHMIQLNSFHVCTYIF